MEVAIAVLLALILFVLLVGRHRAVVAIVGAVGIAVNLAVFGLMMGAMAFLLAPLWS